MREFKIEKVSNMIFITKEEQIFKAWDEEEFTEKKLQNAMKKIQSNYDDEIKFVRTF